MKDLILETNLFLRKDPYLELKKDQFRERKIDRKAREINAIDLKAEKRIVLEKNHIERRKKEIAQIVEEGQIVKKRREVKNIIDPDLIQEKNPLI